MSASAERLDVLLNWLCLARSRNEAKKACDSGAVLVDGVPAKPSLSVRAGQKITLRFPTREQEIRVTEIPTRSVSKKAARELYEVLRDEPRQAE